MLFLKEQIDFETELGRDIWTDIPFNNIIDSLKIIENSIPNRIRVSTICLYWDHLEILLIGVYAIWG